MIRRLCRTWHLPVCLTHPATLPTAPLAQGKLHNLIPQSPTVVFSVFVPVVPFACLSTLQIESQLRGYLLCDAVLISLGKCPSPSSKFPLHFVNASMKALYCIVLYIFFFACLFLLWDCKQCESRDCIFSSSCPQSLAQCLAHNSLSINIYWLNLWMNKVLQLEKCLEDVCVIKERKCPCWLPGSLFVCFKEEI